MNVRHGCSRGNNGFKPRELKLALDRRIISLSFAGEVSHLFVEYLS